MGEGRPIVVTKSWHKDKFQPRIVIQNTQKISQEKVYSSQNLKEKNHLLLQFWKLIW